MSDSPKATLKLKRASQSQDTLNESQLVGGHFYAVFTANDAQFDALKTYVREIQKGTDTTSVETAINAL